MSEIGDALPGGEAGIVGEAGDGRDRVDRGVEDQLRPLRRPEVGERPRLESRPDDRVRDPADGFLRRPTEGPELMPRCRGCTRRACPRRVPLMNVTAEISGQSPWRRTISSAPNPFCTVINSLRPASVLGVPRQPSPACRLRGDDREIRGPKLGGIRGGAEAGRILVPPRHAQAALVQSACAPFAGKGRRPPSRGQDGRRRGCRSPRRRPRTRARSAPLPAGAAAFAFAPGESSVGTSQSESGWASPKAPLSEKISSS